MAESVELTDVGDSSESEDLLHLIRKICPPVTGESENSYKVFCHFALTEPSVTKLANDQGIDLEVLKIWAEDFDWVERIKEWQSIFQAYQRKQWQAREEAILKHWNDRRQKFLEIADQLLARAELMLRHPHVQRVVYEEVVAQYTGQVISTQIVISPVKWQTGDVTTLQKTALALLQQVVGSRELMIDRLTADGYIVTDPSDDADIEEYVLALERLEELERGF